jgi:hypothetical protein
MHLRKILLGALICVSAGLLAAALAIPARSATPALGATAPATISGDAVSAKLLITRTPRMPFLVVSV